MKDVPRQSNGEDCGAFVCQFALYRIRGEKMNFTQAHMTTICSILKEELLNGNLVDHQTQTKMLSNESPLALPPVHTVRNRLKLKRERANISPRYESAPMSHLLQLLPQAQQQQKTSTTPPIHRLSGLTLTATKPLPFPVNTTNNQASLTTIPSPSPTDSKPPPSPTDSKLPLCPTDSTQSSSPTDSNRPPSPTDSKPPLYSTDSTPFPSHTDATLSPSPTNAKPSCGVFSKPSSNSKLPLSDLNSKLQPCSIPTSQSMSTQQTCTQSKASNTCCKVYAFKSGLSKHLKKEHRDESHGEAKGYLICNLCQCSHFFICNQSMIITFKLIP